MTEPLVLEDRHTGERLELLRRRMDGVLRLELLVSLPPHREGPPLHVHYAENESFTVLSGTLSLIVDGRRIDVTTGQTAVVPIGAKHRWWNEGDEPLEAVGYAEPVVDLDRYLQAVFEVVNASPPGRPALIYLAPVILRHRATQRALVMPRPVLAVVFRIAYALGWLLGRYRGRDWPGCPDRCTGAPEVVEGTELPRGSGGIDNRGGAPPSP